MKKMLLTAITAGFALAAMAGQDNLLMKFSTPGPDTYADGKTPVADGECYALVWVKKGATFAGFLADGAVVDPDTVFGIASKNSYKNFSYWDDESKVRYNGVNTRAEVYAEDSRLVYGSVRVGFAYDTEPYESYLDNRMEWKGWDFRSKWYSTFANLRYDTLNDSYFPSKGFRLSLDTHYIFSGYSIYMEDEGMEDGDHYEGDVPPYSVGVANATAVLPIAGRLFIQPSVFFGWQTEEPGHMNFVHTLGAGGTRAGRYIEDQIPFFGYNIGFHACGSFAATAQLDIRYRINHKNFFTLRGGILQDKDVLKDIVKTAPTSYAFGAEIGQKSIIGPMMLGVQWCNLTKFSVGLSVGFDF